MKSYVINLERAVDRREAAIGEFDRCGLQFEFFQVLTEGASPNCMFESMSKINSRQLPGSGVVRWKSMECWRAGRVIEISGNAP